MTRRILAKLGLAAFLMLASALPARAAYIDVTALSGVNLSFNATEVGGTIDFNFNSLNLVSTANGQLVLPAVSATFPDLIITTNTVTQTGNIYTFVPSFNFTQYGVVDFNGVVFDYIIGFGSATGNLLTLSGTVFVDPSSPSQTFTNGINTYDVSAFDNPATFGITFSDQSGNLINSLTTGNGTFDGTASFSQFIVPEPSSVVLLGMGGLLTVVARRRRKA